MKRLILPMLLVMVLLMNLCLCTAAAQEGTVHASALVYTSPGFTPLAESYGTKYIRDNFGLDLEVLPVDIATPESWNIFWASGGYADIIIPYNLTAALTLVDQELCRPFDYELIKEHAPRLHKLLLQNFETEKEILKNLKYKGEVYCVPYFSPTNGMSWVSAVRNDWLKAVGLEIPTTLDELTEVLRAFTFDDPDGNGVQDTYGVNCVPYGLCNVAAYYNTSAFLSFWLNDEGNDIVTNAVSEDYREFLRQVAAWYAAGYMDPEFVTDADDRAAVRSKFASGKMGIYCDHPWWFELERGETNPLRMLCDADPKVDFATNFGIFGGLMKDGEMSPVNSGYNNMRGQASCYFGTECPDEVVIAYLKMVNQYILLYDETEEDYAAMKTWAQIQVGVEGEDWRWDEATNRVVTLRPATPEKQNATGVYMFPAAINMELSRFHGRDDAFVAKAYEIATSPNKVYNGNNFSKPALSDEMVDAYDVMSAYFINCRTSFINGQMNLDTDWDAYVKQMEDYGLYKVIAEYKAGLGI